MINFLCFFLIIFVLVPLGVPSLRGVPLCVTGWVTSFGLAKCRGELLACHVRTSALTSAEFLGGGSWPVQSLHYVKKRTRHSSSLGITSLARRDWYHCATNLPQSYSASHTSAYQVLCLPGVPLPLLPGQVLHVSRQLGGHCSCLPLSHDTIQPILQGLLQRCATGGLKLKRASVHGPR